MKPPRHACKVLLLLIMVQPILQDIKCRKPGLCIYSYIPIHCIPTPAEVAHCACISTILIDIHAHLLIGLATAATKALPSIKSTIVKAT